MQIAASVLKGISGNKHTAHFVLYDQRRRDHLLHSIINRLPTDMQRQFIIDKYTDEFGRTFPCITLSPSGQSTDSIVVVVYSSLVVVYSSHVPPIAIVWVPTFELVCFSSSGLAFNCVYLCGELWGGAVW